jgi:hypothetical protein
MIGCGHEITPYHVLEGPRRREVPGRHVGRHSTRSISRTSASVARRRNILPLSMMQSGRGSGRDQLGRHIAGPHLMSAARRCRLRC